MFIDENFDYYVWFFFIIGWVRKIDVDFGLCFKINWLWYVNGLLILFYFNLINCLCSKRGSGIIWIIICVYVNKLN